MAQLIRRKALVLGNPPHTIRKANLFLALARTAVKQAQIRRGQPQMSPPQPLRTRSTNPAIFHLSPPVKRV
jgi:hypothetical protein